MKNVFHIILSPPYSTEPTIWWATFYGVDNAYMGIDRFFGNTCREVTSYLKRRFPGATVITVS